MLQQILEYLTLLVSFFLDLYLTLNPWLCTSGPVYLAHQLMTKELNSTVLSCFS